MRSTAASASPPPALRVRVAIALVVAVVIGGVAAGIFALAGAASASNEVGSVDGSPITRQELLFHMKRVQPAVANDVRVSSGHEVTDWNAKLTDGSTALDHLTDAAIAEISESRALFGLAFDNKLVGFTDFNGFTEALKAENTSRREQVERGEVVYGQTEFTDVEYYGKLESEVRTGLASALSKGAHPILVVTQDDITSYFTEHRAEWGANVSSYSLTRLAVDADAVAADQLTSRIDAAGGVEPFAKQTPGSTVTTSTFDGATGAFAGSTDPVNPQLAAEIPTLAVGSLTTPVVEGGSIVTYRVDTITVDDEAALTLYGSRIRAVLLDEALARELTNSVAEQNVKLNRDSLNRITMEDLNQ